MKRREVESIIKEKCQEYANQVIVGIRCLGPDCRLSGDDSGLKNVWEEFKCQLQLPTPNRFKRL